MECANPQVIARVSEDETKFLGSVDNPFQPSYRVYVEEFEFPVIYARCGHCMACLLRRSKEWKIRMEHELLMHPGSCGLFATMTYSDANLPAGGSLRHSDLQKFFKRLRKSCGSFRFAACGEYGRRTGRAHYHAIFFGLELPDLCRNSTGRLFRSRHFEQTWGLGNVVIGKAEPDSISYVAGYTAKKLGTRRGEKPLMETVDFSTGLVLDTQEVAPEFFVTSRRPGLGASWVDRYGEQLLRDQEITLQSGKTTKLIPRFYLNRLKDHPWYASFMEQRADLAPGPSDAGLRQLQDEGLRTQFNAKSREVF